ncbi:MAG: protein kinase [Polyangiaceae bacterium]|nr:protein kinase [Polyangiaceae bacterium]MCB9606458.1 protein kinase [Polyangiaceae bacterium]
MIGSPALPDFNPGPNVAGWSVLGSRGSGSLTHAFGAQRGGKRGVLRFLHSNLAGIPELGERFLRDPMIANEVQHPFCVRVLDSGHHQGLPFLVSELADGQSVADLLALGPDTFSPAHALKVMCGALEILDVAHGQNIVHRDLRPESIVVSELGEVWIRDFGFARLREIGGVAAPLAFVPPERLSQGTGALDSRGDLFALGAICFNLLTGETPLSRASSSFDRPSFGLMLPDAPLELVELVDRALMRDPERRFQTAADMYRAARRARRLRELEEPGRFVSSIRQLKTAVAKTQPPIPREDVPSEPKVVVHERIPAAPALPDLTAVSAAASPRVGAAHADVAGPAESPTYAAVPADPLLGQAGSPGAVELSSAATQELQGVSGSLDLEPISDDEVRVLRELFAHWERSLRASLQYGPEHPESERARHRAWAHIARALEASDGALLCNLSPYAFMLADEPVWEPSGSFERIPYRLFADGVRVLGFRAGMTLDEWEKLSECMLTDLDDDPLNDFTTLLWDADLPHVVCQVVDVFQEGDGRAREALDEVRRSVVAVARFDSQVQLSDCWREFRGDPANEQDWQGELERSLGATGRRLSELLEAEANRIKELASALEGERTQGVNRFVYVASSGLLHALRSSSLPMVLVPLEQALNRLGAESALVRLECALSLIETAGRDATLRETLISRVLTARVVEESVVALDELEAQQRELLWARLARLLDDHHAQALADVLTQVSPDFERAILVQLVAVSRGNEQALGQAILRAGLAQALTLVRALARGDNAPARAALMEACAHPEPVVRLEALNALGASSERTNLELRQLLEDPSPEVRLATLRTIADHEVKVVGPALAMRIRSEEFDELTPHERGMALDALARLLPSRAEDVAVELLERNPLVATRAHDETRELAAELLGRTATGADAERALEREQGRRFRNSERVRDASARALESLRRRSVPPPPGDPEQ